MRTPTTNRRDAAIDFGVALGVVLVSLRCIPLLTAVFRHLSAPAAVFILAAFQFSAEGLVPLILMAIRGERFSDYGFNWRNLGQSIALAVCLVVAYDLALSLHAEKWIWVPLRRHNAVRISFAAGFPLSLVGLIVVIATWGFFEAFFGVTPDGVPPILNLCKGLITFSWFSMFIVLHDVLGKNKSLFEAAINFAQFPEDQNKKNRDHEQQELDIHFVSSLPAQGILNAQGILLLGFKC